MNVKNIVITLLLCISVQSAFGATFRIENKSGYPITCYLLGRSVTLPAGAKQFVDSSFKNVDRIAWSGKTMKNGTLYCEQYAVNLDMDSLALEGKFVIGHFGLYACSENMLKSGGGTAVIKGSVPCSSVRVR